DVLALPEGPDVLDQHVQLAQLALVVAPAETGGREGARAAEIKLVAVVGDRGAGAHRAWISHGRSRPCAGSRRRSGVATGRGPWLRWRARSARAWRPRRRAYGCSDRSTWR